MRAHQGLWMLRFASLAPGPYYIGGYNRDFGMLGSGSRRKALGFRVQGCRVWGFRIEGLP